MNECLTTPQHKHRLLGMNECMNECLTTPHHKHRLLGMNECMNECLTTPHHKHRLLGMNECMNECLTTPQHKHRLLGMNECMNECLTTPQHKHRLPSTDTAADIPLSEMGVKTLRRTALLGKFLPVSADYELSGLKILRSPRICVAVVVAIVVRFRRSCTRM